MKIKFKSDDDLPLGKILNIFVCMCIIIVKSVFQKSSNYYQQVSLHECFYDYEYEFDDGSYVIV